MSSSDTSTDSLWGQIKQVLSEFFRGSRERVSGLAETIDRQAGIQRLAAQIRLLRRERHQLLLTMGKKAYSLHTRGKVRNRDILSDCLHIDEIGAETRELQGQIEEIRREAGPGEELVLDLEDETPVAEDEEPAQETAPAEAADQESCQMPTEAPKWTAPPPTED